MSDAITDAMNDAATARRALPLIDLTNLEDDCTPADIRALAARAETPHGKVAALCVWPDFVELSADLVSGTGIDVATVVNFPGGDRPLSEVVALTRRCVAAGATEIDTVIPRADGDAVIAAHVEAVREACGPARLKTILETGEMGSEMGGGMGGEAAIRTASRLCIEGGADFIKTSTGKVAVNATPEAARWMLEEIRDSGRHGVGLKPAGGIRTVADAAAYLALSDQVMGEGWARKATFRFGASSLLGNVLALLGQGGGAAPGGY